MKYITNKILEEYEIHLYDVCKSALKKDRYGLIQLTKELEEKAADLFADGLIKDGASYDVPLEKAYT